MIMPENIDYSRLPAHMQDGMRRYIDHGIKPGSFLVAVLSNDLMEAFKRADDVNVAAMVEYARFLYNQAPCVCYGSPEHVKDWISAGGLKGGAA